VELLSAILALLALFLAGQLVISPLRTPLQGGTQASRWLRKAKEAVND